MITKSSLKFLGFFIVFFFFTINFPEQFWATNALSLVDQLIWLIPLIILFFAAIHRFKVFEKAPSNIWATLNKGTFSLPGIIAFSALMGYIFFQFPIANDHFGDAFQYHHQLDTVIRQLPPDFNEQLFSFSLAPSEGRKTVLYLINYWSLQFEATPYAVFQWIGVFGGALFVGLWMFLIRSEVKLLKLRILLLIAGCCAPFMLVFFGHTETYALIYPLLLLWLILWIRQRKQQSIGLLVAMLLLLFLLIKLHSVNALLTLLFGFSALQQFAGNTSFSKQLLTWRGLLTWTGAPILLIGCYLYFGHFGAHDIARELINTNEQQQLFLPLFGSDAPLDRYYLFSWHHLLDFVNLGFWWSPLGLLLLLIYFFKRKEMAPSAHGLLKQLTFILGLLILLLFVINPQVSLPMDWDLFSFPAVFLLALLALATGRLEHHELNGYQFAVLFKLGLLSISIFLVSSDPEKHSQREELIGRHIFNSYYAHSSRIIITALSDGNDMDAYLERKAATLRALKDNAIPGNDPMYANLLMDDGYFYLKYAKRFDLALKRLKEAIQYNPTQGDLHLLLVECYFELGNYRAAYEACLQLMQLQYPNGPQATKMAIHAALEAELYKEAQELSANFLQAVPTDITVQEVYKRLLLNEDIDQLKLLFARPQAQN